MDVRYLVLLLLMVACLPQAKVSSGNLGSTATTGGTTSGSNTIPDSETTWNYLGATSKNISINVSNFNNAYVAGASSEKYLNIQDASGTYTNFSYDYCLVSKYSIGGVAYELRTRVVPVSYYDFTQQRTIKIFRADFNDVTNSASMCGGFSLSSLNSAGVQITETPLPSSNSFTNPANVCPTCTALLTSQSVRLFQKKPSQLLEVITTNIDLSHLSLSINPNNNTTSNTGTCTQSDCKTRGYDCCLDNQCVKDGGLRPSALTQYQSQYQNAEQQRLQNPLAYLNYPQIYYICGTSISTTSGSSGGGANYDAAFAQLLKDYKCIQDLKGQSHTTPFQQDLLNTSLTFTCYDGSTLIDYKQVISRMYQTCGCSKSTLSDMITYCPAYDYSVTAKDALNTPTAIDCYTPPSASGSVPSQQTVSLNSRSAPHRFFDTNGNEKTSATMSTSLPQEGDIFQYLDAGDVLPSQQNFSMNAILGQMSVTLDKTLPAKSVTVALDQVYILSTTSGYYTPCPTCGKDSWTQALTAYPSTSYGVGLEALGHTTQRDALGTNTTGGNYEDTIFGRACWVPPTMLPYSHSARVTTQAQRLNRLKTQAALYVNGYQKDWFGFNKGALIGSFDVTWFAVGKGRIVKATSTKLFLAINAPFADVASPTLQVVNVQAYDGITQAAQVDYDPQYPLSHPYQNEAGSCQANHLCTADSDCISKLGWEYMCADVLNVKTQWPAFDSNGVEQSNISNLRTLDQILQQKKFASPTTKRCVYRGAGAPCLTNVTSVTDLNKRKTLTCAPNFYCASTALSGVFNTKVARFAAALQDIPVARNHLYGKDANVLGRPLSYVASSDSSALSSDVSMTLVENLSTYDALAGAGTGLCQPGKALPDSGNYATLANPYNQHLTGDMYLRADFISQIASCNSGLYTDSRHSSCPVLQADGNYEMFGSTTLDLTAYKAHARNQNACGLETLLNNTSLAQSPDVLSNYSPFRLIEAKPLNAQIIIDKTLVRDACLRRAGQVCQTDYDCSPNKMHADQIDYFNTSYFGNDAEKKYYSEYLICGQADPEPLPSDTLAFQNYDMTKNRCCRAVGQNLSTYTADIATKGDGTVYDPATVGLKMSLPPGTASSDPQRYSRLATVNSLGTIPTRPLLSAYQARTPGGNIDISSQNVNLMTPQQWMTLGEANSESCCGGGWIRKFSDGSHDWSRRDRLYLDVSNFRCINSRTSLFTNPTELNGEYGGSAISILNRDYAEYCDDSSHTKDGCVQYNITSDLADTAPVSNAGNSITINTITPVFDGSNPDFYFVPLSADSNSQVIMDFSAATGRKNISLQIPSYASQTEFDAKLEAPIAINLFNSDGTIAGRCTPTAGLTTLIDPMSKPAGICTAGTCCYQFDPTPSKRTLKVIVSDTLATGTNKYGVQFTFNRPGSSIPINRTTPGTSSYYLRRLGRLELSGVPQIAYEPLYCNDNSDTLVKGIFDSHVLNRTQFQTSTFSFKNGGTTYYTGQLGLATETIFSSNDFQCCTPLGKNTTNPANCCSGHGTAVGTSGTSFTCGLPAGANLNVYFNRFISNEGRGTDQPGGGFLDADFDAQTGEPLLTSSVANKMSALGTAYCSSGKVRQGGAFGSFAPEPQGPNTNITNPIYNIVDSSNDHGQNSNGGQTVDAGYNAFMNGFRWNHHLYCDD
jgi:hypothetical protein